MQAAQTLENLSAVFFDLYMDDTDGLPGVEVMLRLLGEVPLIVLSGTLDAALIAACIRIGARGFLSKGSDPEVIDHALPLVLSGGIYAPMPCSAAPAIPPHSVPPSPAALEGLTARQRQILAVLLEGKSNKEIARALGILEGTVKVHLRTVMARLGVRNRTQLALLIAGAGSVS